MDYKVRVPALIKGMEERAGVSLTFSA